MAGEQVAFIAGGTSGVGKEMALEYAREGFDVVVGFGANEKAAEETLDKLSDVSPEGDHTAVQSDISSLDGRLDLINNLLYWGDGRKVLNQVVLAASGGLERDRDAETYPWQINVEAQTGLAGLFAEQGLLGEESTLTFLTSHQAAYLHETVESIETGEQVPIAPWDAINEGYQPIAETKKEGMLQLLKMHVDGRIPGRFLVASTDMIPDSKVVALAAILVKNPELKGRAAKIQHLVETRQAELEAAGLDSALWNSKDFGEAVVEKAIDPSWTKIGALFLPDHADMEQRITDSARE